MMRVPILLASAVIALAVPAAAQQPLPVLTREQALTLPREQVAEIVFRQLAARMDAMSRPTFVSIFPHAQGGLGRMFFATAPRASPAAGLCEATRVEIGFNGDGEGGGRAADISTSNVYKVIGDLEPHGERTDDDREGQSAQCARAGPAIAAETGDFGAQAFFAFRGDYHPLATLIALQRAIGGARSGAYRDVECAPRASVGAAPNCLETLRQFSALDLSRLVEVAVEQLDRGEARYRIEARFLIEGGANYEISWRVSLEVGGLHSGRMALGHASISQGHAVIE